MPGFNFTYTLTARNTGPAPVAIGQTVTVTDTIPAGISLRAAVTGTGWTCSTVPVTPPFPAAGPVTVTCTRTLTAHAGRQHQLPGDHGAGGRDDRWNDHQHFLRGTDRHRSVRRQRRQQLQQRQRHRDRRRDLAADLRVVSKTVSPNPVQAGQDLTYVITVQNDGPGNATNVVVTDPFTATGNTR